MPNEDAEQYEDLNDRQQCFVDAVARLRLTDKIDESAETIKEKMEELGGNPYGNSSIYKSRKVYSEIIENRKQHLANERTSHDGKDELAKDEDGRPIIDDRMTHLSEIQAKKKEEMEKESVEEWMFVGMTPNTLFRVIRTAEENSARELFDQMMEWRND